MLAVKYQTEIQHLYPVRGHSYCQCDRNFRLYGKKKKMKEKVETPEEYIDLIKNSRDPPFTMVDVSKITIKDFEKLADINKNITEIKVRQAVKIHYFGNGLIDVYYAYNAKPSTFSILKNFFIF